MVTARQTFHGERRRAEHFVQASLVTFLSAVGRLDHKGAERASTDLAQGIDDLLALVGGHRLSDEESLDCPDCGQYIPDAIDILTEGEGDDITEGEQVWLDDQQDYRER